MRMAYRKIRPPPHAPYPHTLPVRSRKDMVANAGVRNQKQRMRSGFILCCGSYRARVQSAPTDAHKPMIRVFFAKGKGSERFADTISYIKLIRALLFSGVDRV